MPNPRLVKKVYKLHLDLYRELNDTHIFLSHTLPLLGVAASQYATTRGNSDKTFVVPSREGKKGTARRTPEEVAELFRRFASRELRANMLVACVSRLESMLNDVLRTFLLHFPGKLSIGLKGGDSSKTVPISLIVESEDRDEILASVIDARLQGVFYAEPKEYLGYFESVTGVQLPEKSFAEFVEVKATRDLIIHNNSMANELYIRKAGKNARAKDGMPVGVDKIYFSSAISTMKNISSEIHKQVNAAHA